MITMTIRQESAEVGAKCWKKKGDAFKLGGMEIIVKK